MDILIVTEEVEQWTTFEKDVKVLGHAVTFSSNKTQAKRLCLDQRFHALIWDAIECPQAHRETVIEFLMVDAAMHQCMVCEVEAEQFHEDTEGLGLLPPMNRSRKAENFLAAIATIDATFAFQKQ